MASSARNHVCSGAPGLEIPTIVPARSSTERVVSVDRAGTASTTGGAAERPNTIRGASPVLAAPKRNAASTDVAARSASFWASASAAPDSARVVRSVTRRPASAK